MAKEIRKDEEKPDIRTKAISLVIPGLVAGVFLLLGIYLTWRLNRDDNGKNSSPERKSEKVIECDIERKIGVAIEMIASVNANGNIDPDDILFLDVYREKFESYVLNADICSTAETSKIYEELKTVNEILFNE